MNAEHLRQAAGRFDAMNEEASKHAARKLAPGEQPTRYYLADCMRHLADAIGDKELTPKLYSEVFPTLPNVFSSQTINYGPKDRERSYADAVAQTAEWVGCENPFPEHVAKVAQDSGEVLAAGEGSNGAPLQGQLL